MGRNPNYADETAGCTADVATGDVMVLPRIPSSVPAAASALTRIDPCERSRRLSLGSRVVLLLIGLLWLGVTSVSGQVTIEYVAHAAVVVESDGVRVLIDPYEGSRWMGYGFPSDLEVDAVLVTHPHYDHDAGYQGGTGVPVFTEPGRYRVGRVDLIGVESEHLGAARFRARGAEPHNVVWTVEAGGVRITHLGDNRVLTRDDREAIGRTDVLMAPVFHDQQTAREEAASLGARLLVPIHFGLEEMRADGYGVSGVDAWLEGGPARRDDDHRLELSRNESTSDLIVHVFEPHPSVRPWSEDLARAWRLHTEARGLVGNAEYTPAAALLQEAVDLAPGVMTFPLALGEALQEAGRVDEAESVWTAALAGAGRTDAEPTLRVRAALARRLADTGRMQEAEVLWRIIAATRRSYAADVLAEATDFLRGR